MRQQQGTRAASRGSGARLGSGVPTADYDDIKGLLRLHGAIK
jgi:hypothetical protein